ncbi:tyrosine-protein phosphatase [Scheffersomyces stipitis CBS 6054]|uniref:protein-tyrosine-phosphatase n=1 Tax=Scheffersomyces stipitis (strain ATCC 58785 / CBS 6054 / NBRC 10063 / NRRL Y-11545) TaxID=322104 RepID=A3LRW5_PICST|nr:tyrosine-protein phosphatase [Scheffersomyces stipitis CBS 6054]ABN65802.2 tyrosine-protein phosphatase [Scheffersomyces stipitis CBS 6054]
MSPFLVESAANTDQDRSQRSTTFNVETPPTPRFHHQPYTRSSSFTAAIAAAAAIAATPTLSNKIQKLPAMSSSQRRSSHDGLPTNSNKTTSKTSTTSSSSTTNSTNHITDSITNTGAIPITSIPEPSNAFPNSDPLVGMVNYSPKHSRKRSSLTMNRNMKNLSLNLGVSHSNSSSVDSNSSYTYNANSPSKSLPFNPPPSFGNSSQRSLPLSKLSSHNQYDSPLVTPAVTRTPNLPPMIPRRANSSSAPHSSDIDVSREMGFKFPASTNVSPGQIRSWSNTSSRKNYSNSSSNSLDSSDIRKLIIPEELQESNSLNAYKDGPRNVLNGQIYLYSDPVHSDSKVDINNFDLIVNVAKECQDMSLSYRNQVAGQREYIHVPWSHTSAISKDLLAITTKMEHFYSSGRRILVHCQCGVSRSACVVVAFFMSKFGLNVNEAYELLKSGTENINETVNRIIGEKGNRIDACDRICPNMSLIFELMEFGEILGQN